MKFSELQQLLQEKLGIDHLADIARELDVSPQAVSNWKARDRVPYKYIIEVRKRIQELDFKDNEQNKTNTTISKQANSQNSYSQYFTQDTISVIDILLIITKNLRIIITVPIIFCILMIINVQFFVQPVYESKVKFMSSSGNNEVSQAFGIASQFGINLSSNQQREPMWLYPEIIKSRTLARSMLNRKFNTEKYGSQKDLLQIITYGNNDPSMSHNKIIKAGIDAVINMIRVVDKQSYYVLIVTASEPTFARDFAIAVIEELDIYQKQYYKAKNSKAKQFIRERIADTEKELQKSEEALKNFRDRNRRIENSPALLLEQQRISREVAVLTGVFTTLKQQLETTKIEEVKDSKYVIVLDPPEAPLQRSRPKKKVMVIWAGIVGFILGIVISFFKEFVINNYLENDEKFTEVKSLITNNIFQNFQRSYKNK